MQQAFQILKDRPTISLRLTRNSVCAGDDAFPHDEVREVPSFVDPVALVSNMGHGYLPGFNGLGPGALGSGHIWDCLLNGVLIATITKTEVLPRVREVTYSGSDHLHFEVHSTPPSITEAQLRKFFQEHGGSSI